MATSMNVLDLEIFTREYMRQYIKSSQPDMDISDNSAFDDIFVKPMINILSPLFPIVTNTELKSNLRFANYLTNEEIEDIGINNYSVARREGYAGTTAQTFGFSRVGEKGITIPQGVVVTTPDGLVYTTTYSTTYSKEEVKQGYNSSTGTYDVIAYIKADDVGSKYNVGENTISICQTPFNDYLVYTSNKNAVTDGTDKESVEEYVSRIRTYYADQHLGTSPGYIKWLRDICPELKDHKVIGYLDEGMERDTIEILARDSKNQIVFEPNEEGYYYARTKERHIGGCVDIYVRGSEYAVETAYIQSASNIICVNGPIVAGTITVKNSDNYSNTSVPATIAHIKKIPTESPADIDDNVKWYSVDTIPAAEYNSYVGVTNVDNVINDKVGTYDVVSRKPDTTGVATLIYQVVAGTKIDDFYVNIIALGDAAGSYDISGVSIEYGQTLEEWTKVEHEEETAVGIGENYYNVTVIPQKTFEEAKYIKVSYIEGSTNDNGMLHSITMTSETSDVENKALLEALKFSNISNQPSVAVTENLSLPVSASIDEATEASVTWESSATGVISEEGVVTRQGVNIDVTITAKASFSTSATSKTECVKVFDIVVLSMHSDVWEKCTAENAEKTLVFINDFEKGNVTLSYMQKTSNQEDTNQPISNTYKIGFESVQLNGPLSESLLTASFSDNGTAWSEEQYKDWGEQLKIALGTDLGGQDDNASAEEIQDMLSNIKIKRYKRTTNEQLLQSGEIDDNGLGNEHVDHKYDSYFIGSSQEIVFAEPITEGAGSVLKILPNTTAVSNGGSGQSGIAISYSYNDTLHTVQSSMFENNNRILTNDVIVREANRTAVNIALKIKMRNEAELTSARRSQIYAAIQSLFDEAGINGKVEQSDIVGRLYTDPTTSSFVEYIRLALDAFYCPDDINAELVYKNLGDFIQADSKSYLYLNKLVISGLDEEVNSSDEFQIYAVNEVGAVAINIGDKIVGHKVRASARYGKEGETVIEGTATIVSINGMPKDTLAENKEYGVSLIFEADDDRYENGYISGTATGLADMESQSV